MNAVKSGLIALAVVFLAARVLAQSADCPVFAIEAVRAACADTSRNMACYGAGDISAETTAGVEAVFAQAGDTTDLHTLRALTINGGIAVLRVQANFADAAPQENVTLIGYGDITLTNLGAADAPVTLPITARTGANIRALPRENAEIRGSLRLAQAATAIGRLSDSSWLLIDAPAASGWVLATLVNVEGDVATLNVVDPNVPQYGPMQALALRSGECGGLLMQTPAFSGRALLSVNAVNLRLDSTLLLQADDELRLTLLSGSVLAEAEGAYQFVAAGTQARVPLNAEGRAAGALLPLEPYDQDILVHAPLSLLPEAVTVPPTLTEAQIAALEEGETPTAPAIEGELWLNFAALLSDTCGGASESAAFPLTLRFDDTRTLQQVAWNDLRFIMTAEGVDYIGAAALGDATYTLRLTLAAATYTGELTVTFTYAPGCAWRFRWEGRAG